jgi:hypothetical protein
VVAVLSALILAGGYVATRAVPGLWQSFQVFGGEGGGRAFSGQSSGNSDRVLPSSKLGLVVQGDDLSPAKRSLASKPVSKPSSQSLREVVAPSIMSSSKSGPIFAAPGPAVQPRPMPARQMPRYAALSDGTVVELPGRATGSPGQPSAAKKSRPHPAASVPLQPAPQPQAPAPRQEIMGGSKSAAIFYGTSR